MVAAAQKSTPQANPKVINRQLRENLLTNAVEVVQQIFTTTVTGTPIGQNVFNIPPKFVGLLKGFFIETLATVTNNTSAAITPSIFGAAPLLQQVVFTDLNNYVRHQTTGWHLSAATSYKRRRPYGCAFTGASNDNIFGYGLNYTDFTQTSSISAGDTGTIRMIQYLPICYADEDTRGSVFLNVVNATANLQLTYLTNAIPGLTTASDQLFAPYKVGTTSTGNANVTSLTVTVYQSYLDQLPVYQQGPMAGKPALPFMDLSTYYELKSTTVTGITPTQDFPIPYSNFRAFLSTTMIYDQNGVYNAGTDVNYWALQAANTYQILKVDPQLLTTLMRNELQMDPPTGMYYLPTRKKPLNTIQYGNLNLVLNASTAAANSSVAVGYEDFSFVNTVTSAGSLPGG